MFNKLKQLFNYIQSKDKIKSMPKKCHFFIQPQPKQFEKITVIQSKSLKYKLD